jgi:hypothetical protein
MMDDYSADGQPIQSGLQNSVVVLTDNSPSYSMFGLHVMVVVALKYVKQPGSRSNAQVEYECRDIETGDILSGCRRLDVMSGLTNGDDDVLHPATKMRPGAPGKLSRQTPAQDTDGDRVLVGFIGGSRQRPVIIGVLRHTLATYGAQESDGERRLTTHMGTTIEIKKDGQYTITHKTGATVNIDNDGNIQVRPAAGKDVFIGDKGASENLVLGQAFKTMMDTVLNAIATHFHGSGVGPTTAPTNAVTFTQEAALLTNLLSDMAFTQKEQT